MNPVVVAIAVGGGVWALARYGKGTPALPAPVTTEAPNAAPPASTSPPVLGNDTSVLGAGAGSKTCGSSCGGGGTQKPNLPTKPGPGPSNPNPPEVRDHRTGGQVVCIRAPCHVNPSEAGKAGGESPIETSTRIKFLGPAPVRW